MQTKTIKKKLTSLLILAAATTIAPLAQALTFPSLSDPSEETFIRNVKYSTQYANIDEGMLDIEKITGRASEWYFERYGSYYRIKNRTTGEYLHTLSGSVKAGDVSYSSSSSHWIVENYSDYVRIRNRYRSNHYLHAENGYLQSGTISSSWTGARWLLASSEPTVTLSGVVSSFPNTSGSSTTVPTGLPDCSPTTTTSTTSAEAEEQTVTLSGVVSSFPDTSGAYAPGGTNDQPRYTLIQNCWLAHSKLDVEDDELGLQAYTDSASVWSFEKVGDYYRIQNRATGEYLHNEYGVLESGNIQSGWWSAQWDIQEYDGYVKIRNRWRSNDYLHANDGYIYSGPISSSWDSAKWKINIPLPTVDTTTTSTTTTTSSGTPAGPYCTWSTYPSYGNGNYNVTYYEYQPVGACKHSLKKVTTAYGRTTIEYQ